MDEYESLSHTKWECKYHVVFIPKCRRKTLYVELRKHLGEVFRKLAEQKESRIEEGHLLTDHVHMMIAIPPKYAVSQVIGYIKGKSAIHLARVYGEKKRNFVGQHFWARGYFVSAVGQPGKRRQSTGTDEPLALTRHPQVAHQNRGCVGEARAACETAVWRRVNCRFASKDAGSGSPAIAGWSDRR
jgi:putative transposase